MQRTRRTDKRLRGGNHNRRRDNRSRRPRVPLSDISATARNSSNHVSFRIPRKAIHNPSNVSLTDGLRSLPVPPPVQVPMIRKRPAAELIAELRARRRAESDNMAAPADEATGIYSSTQDSAVALPMQPPQKRARVEESGSQTSSAQRSFSAQRSNAASRESGPSSDDDETGYCMDDGSIGDVHDNKTDIDDDESTKDDTNAILATVETECDGGKSSHDNGETVVDDDDADKTTTNNYAPVEDSKTTHVGTTEPCSISGLTTGGSGTELVNDEAFNKEDDRALNHDSDKLDGDDSNGDKSTVDHDYTCPADDECSAHHNEESTQGDGKVDAIVVAAQESLSRRIVKVAANPPLNLPSPDPAKTFKEYFAKELEELSLNHQGTNVSLPADINNALTQLIVDNEEDEKYPILQILAHCLGLPMPVPGATAGHFLTSVERVLVVYNPSQMRQYAEREDVAVFPVIPFEGNVPDKFKPPIARRTMGILASLLASGAFTSLKSIVCVEQEAVPSFEYALRIMLSYECPQYEQLMVSFVDGMDTSKAAVSSHAIVSSDVATTLVEVGTDASTDASAETTRPDHGLTEYDIKYADMNKDQIHRKLIRTAVEVTRDPEYLDILSTAIEGRFEEVYEEEIELLYQICKYMHGIIQNPPKIPSHLQPLILPALPDSLSKIVCDDFKDFAAIVAFAFCNGDPTPIPSSMSGESFALVTCPSLWNYPSDIDLLSLQQNGLHARFKRGAAAGRLEQPSFDATEEVGEQLRKAGILPEALVDDGGLYKSGGVATTNKLPVVGDRKGNGKHVSKDRTKIYALFTGRMIVRMMKIGLFPNFAFLPCFGAPTWDFYNGPLREMIRAECPEYLPLMQSEKVLHASAFFCSMPDLVEVKTFVALIAEMKLANAGQRRLFPSILPKLDDVTCYNIVRNSVLVANKGISSRNGSRFGPIYGPLNFPMMHAANAVNNQDGPSRGGQISWSLNLPKAHAANEANDYAEQRHGGQASSEDPNDFSRKVEEGKSKAAKHCESLILNVLNPDSNTIIFNMAYASADVDWSVEHEPTKKFFEDMSELRDNAAHHLKKAVVDEYLRENASEYTFVQVNVPKKNGEKKKVIDRDETYVVHEVITDIDEIVRKSDRVLKDNRRGKFSEK